MCSTRHKINSGVWKFCLVCKRLGKKDSTWILWNVQHDGELLFCQKAVMLWSQNSFLENTTARPEAAVKPQILWQVHASCCPAAQLRKSGRAAVTYTRLQRIHARLLQKYLKILPEHLQTASLKGDELGNSTSPTKEKESLQNSSGMQKNLTTLLNIFSTLLVITNLYGVYIPSIIFITRDQRGIMTGGCKLFTQRPCLSKQREQLFYFNHL